MIVLLKSVFVREYCSYKQAVFFVILMLFVPQTWKPYHYRQWAANFDVYSWPLSIYKGSSACHTYCDTGLPYKFIWSSLSNCDTHTRCRACSCKHYLFSNTQPSACMANGLPQTPRLWAVRPMGLSFSYNLWLINQVWGFF